MKSEDAHLLDTMTTAFNNLRAQGSPLGIDVRQVVVQVHASGVQQNVVRYAWDDQNNDWDITAE